MTASQSGSIVRGRARSGFSGARGAEGQENTGMQLQERPPEMVVEMPEAASRDAEDMATAQAGGRNGDGGRGEIEAHGLYRVGLAYGRLAHRLRWVILALWVVALAVSLPFAARLSSVLSGGGYSFEASESVKVNHLAVDVVHQPASTLLVVFQSDATPVADAAYQDEVNGFADRARAFPHVTGVQRGPVGRDGKTTYVALSFDQGGEAVQAQLADVRALLPGGADAGPARAYFTGSPAIYRDFTDITQSETERAEALGLPLALLVLIVVFGALLAAALPLVLALVSVPIALALVYAVALHQQTSVFVLSLASIIGLGISIDYSLFMVRRFREEIAAGRPVRDAVGWTVATSGEAILFSGLAVMIGFVGLLLIGLPFMTSLGVGGALVVGVSVTAALTLLPALLGILGHRVNALRVPLLGRLVGAAGREEGAREGGAWHRLALGVMRRPLLVLLGVFALLVALGWPIFSLRVGTPDATALPHGAESRRGLDILDAQFPGRGDGNPVVIAVQTADGSSVLTADNLDKIDALTGWLTRQDGVSGVVSLTQFPVGPQGVALPKEQLFALYSSGAYQQTPALAQLVGSMASDDTSLITVEASAPANTDAAHALVDRLRAHKAEGRGLRVYVGGFQALTQDFNDYLYGNFPKAIAFVLLATFVVLLLMFRSLLLPLKAVLVNVLSVGAAYGALVAVFQWGFLANVLGFEAQGYLEDTIPILLFCVLFGLSMDYEVFLLSRIREEWLRTANNRFAVARGLEKTGGVITSAALLFVVVAGAFTFTGIVVTKEIGLGLTVAVLVDAAIIRTLLVPATMRLLGRWNWWLPGRPLPPKQAAG